MNTALRKSLLIFVLGFMVMGGVLFVFPINLFPGKIVELHDGNTTVVDAPLSLSYFIGIGYHPEDMIDVQDFYLSAKGYALAFCFLFGLPFLIALRFYYRYRSNE